MNDTGFNFRSKYEIYINGEKKFSFDDPDLINDFWKPRGIDNWVLFESNIALKQYNGEKLMTLNS